MKWLFAILAAVVLLGCGHNTSLEDKWVSGQVSLTFEHGKYQQDAPVSFLVARTVARYTLTGSKLHLAEVVVLTLDSKQNNGLVSTNQIPDQDWTLTWQGTDQITLTDGKQTIVYKRAG